LEKIPKLVPTWERFFYPKIYIDLELFGFLGDSKKLQNRKKGVPKPPKTKIPKLVPTWEKESWLIGTNNSSFLL